MRKRSDQLLKEYPRRNKTATRVVNNIHVSKPELLEMARFSERERERGEESETVSTVSDWCIILASLTPTYIGMGRPGFPSLMWLPWPSGLTNKARPTALTQPRRP